MTARLLLTIVVREPTLAEVLAELRELVAEVRAFRADSRRRNERAPPSCRCAGQLLRRREFTAAGVSSVAEDEPQLAFWGNDRVRPVVAHCISTQSLIGAVEPGPVSPDGIELGSAT